MYDQTTTDVSVMRKAATGLGLAVALLASSFGAATLASASDVGIPPWQERPSQPVIKGDLNLREERSTDESDPPCEPGQETYYKKSPAGFYYEVPCPTYVIEFPDSFGPFHKIW